MPTREDLLLEKRRYGLPEVVSEAEQELLDKNTPVQKIIGHVELAGVTIDLSNKVLIPRYETEEMVLKFLPEIKKNAKVLDLCTGSGFIAIALKKARPDLQVFGSDIDKDAVNQATINASINGTWINFVQSDLFDAFKKTIKSEDDKFDILFSNPPYIGYEEKSQMSPSVLDHEPHHALFAEDFGMEFYNKILDQAKSYVKDGGTIYFEINPLHFDFWEILSRAYDLQIFTDINGKARFVKIVLRYKSR
ncbi:peptide chain release factor N(5)-glutamine methyltransferase [Mycoplasma sp. Ms02]|uniref:peptide chain release factor N(5)-glutamine methyltransferase n=1 Tax=Mycoplasma sp. Ms02 TaxID=353851 RepID=UPI001C8AB1CF|nr:peptide chain release factor N(5)-glutamine methyltransferase [Mycoplasma sp. Ms02]QZE12653.1 peptide chain release factor N(5)-glutamine methyltransferase [Mycoplasma sp. Ms02]